MKLLDHRTTNSRDTPFGSGSARSRPRPPRPHHLRGRLVHRLDHLDAAVMADIGEPRGQRRVGDEGVDLAHMRDAHRRASA